MKRTRGRVLATLPFAGALAFAVAHLEVETAFGQTRPRTTPIRRPTPTASAQPSFDAGTAFRTHFGIDLATNLLRSNDAEERLRGLERAAAIGGPEARLLFTQALAPAPDARGTQAESVPSARDGRALVAAARGLAKELLDEVRVGRTPARSLGVSTGAADAGVREGPRTLGLVNTLVTLVDSNAGLGRGDFARADLVELARGVAARALALSGDPRAIEALVKTARDADAKRPAALTALAALRGRAAKFGAVDLLAPPNLTPQTVALAGAVGDLRSVEALGVALRAADARLRAAGIVALAEIGTPNVAESARALLRDPDPNVRVAAAEALVLTDSRDAAPVVAALLTDDSTFDRAVDLAGKVESAEIDRVLFERARKPGADATRRRIAFALSRHRSESSALALANLLADPLLRSDAIGGLGRTRAPNARKLLEALARDPRSRRLGVRGLTMHALVHGVDRDAALELSRPLATTGVVVERALFIFTHVALGALSVEVGLRERDADARAAAAMAALTRLDDRACHALAERRGTETDANVRVLLASAFACERGAEGASSDELWARARGGGPDAPLSWMVLGARTHERSSSELYAFLASGDAVVRSHIARGLGASKRDDAPGRLARALLYENDANVRRALVHALAVAGGGGMSTPSGREALELTATWDPEEDVRALAQTVREGATLRTTRDASETAWIRLATREGESGGGQLAAVVRSDGLAVPIAFDADGFALVTGLPPGAIHLVLAPRVPRPQAP